MAGWLIMVGSAFALGLVVQRLSGLHTLENLRVGRRASWPTPPGSDLGVSTDTAITAIRTPRDGHGRAARPPPASWATRCCGAAGAPGLAVTVLAVPLFLAGMVTGGFITSVVAASAAILWLQPARAWFDGKPLPERRTAPAAPRLRAAAACRRRAPIAAGHRGPGRPPVRRPCSGRAC